MNRHLASVVCAAALGGCSIVSAEREPDSTDADGKADGLQACPDEVAINNGQGSNRRCYDTTNGRFVPTVCCAEACEGADWREQSNGTVCAWVHDAPEGSQVGQFAPRMCCELQDALACSRAVWQDGACIDPLRDSSVDASCCGDAAPACDPWLANAIRGCISDVQADLATDPESPSMNALELLHVCTHEGDLLGPMFDDLCDVAPQLELCSADFETFFQAYVQPCAEALRPEHDCALGRVWQDTLRQPNVAMIERVTLTLADAGSLPALESSQVIESVRQSAFGEVADLSEAFAFVDDGRIDRMRLFELGNARAFTAYTYGAGDNLHGAVFDHGTTTIATRVLDGDLYDGSPVPQLGCGIPIGRAGQPCTDHASCGPGLQCWGMISAHPAYGQVGRCTDPTLGTSSPARGNLCQTLQDCPLEEGLVCAGMQFELGHCRAAWKVGSYHEEATFEIPDAGTLERDLGVFGLATVVESMEIDLTITHPDPSQLRVSLRGALQDEGTTVAVFDGTVDSVPGALVRISGPIGFPGDEQVNGLWTLVVEDRAAGSVGTLHGWSLHLTTRWD
jgi:hypothetical protein